jgi:hypothetical protein
MGVGGGCHRNSLTISNLARRCQRMYPRLRSEVQTHNITPLPESASELYRPSLSAKLLPNVVDRGCHVVSVTKPYCSILDF